MNMNNVDYNSIVIALSKNPGNTHISVEFNIDLVTVYAEKQYFDVKENDEDFLLFDLLTSVGFSEKQIEKIL